MNIANPNKDSTLPWPKCSYFGIYDGHGGAYTADFLRDNLHQYVIQDEEFPFNPKQALRNGFARAEQELYEEFMNGGEDKSGSCAIAVLIVGNQCYIANVGDS